MREMFFGGETFRFEKYFRRGSICDANLKGGGKHAEEEKEFSQAIN